MKITELAKKYFFDAVGAGVVNPDYKMKTNVNKRIHGGILKINQKKEAEAYKKALISAKQTFDFEMKNAKSENDKKKAKEKYDSRVKQINENYKLHKKGLFQGSPAWGYYGMSKGKENWLGFGEKGRVSKDSAELNDIAATKKDVPAKVLNIKISKNSSGGYDGQVYYSKNGENDLVSPFGVYASGKWAFPFGRTSTRLTDKDKKMIELKIKKLLAQKGFVVKDSAEFENDGYDLGINTPENVSKEPVKVISVSTKKEPDGISGVVKFSKGKKTYSEYFMVYRSGNWDVKPISNTGMNYTLEDRTKLIDSVRNKLLKFGIKAK